MLNVSRYYEINITWIEDKDGGFHTLDQTTENNS